MQLIYKTVVKFYKEIYTIVVSYTANHYYYYYRFLLSYAVDYASVLVTPNVYIRYVIVALTFFPYREVLSPVVPAFTTVNIG